MYPNLMTGEVSELEDQDGAILASNSVILEGTARPQEDTQAISVADNEL